KAERKTVGCERGQAAAGTHKARAREETQGSEEPAQHEQQTGDLPGRRLHGASPLAEPRSRLDPDRTIRATREIGWPLACRSQLVNHPKGERWTSRPALTSRSLTPSSTSTATAGVDGSPNRRANRWSTSSVTPSRPARAVSSAAPASRATAPAPPAQPF